MALIVQKYGGTSVCTVARFKAVAQRVAGMRAAGNDVIVVVSAMAGETNLLLGLANEVSSHPDQLETDLRMSTC